MSVTIGTATFSRLTAQPFGYDAANTERGLTARRWLVTGLMTPTEWLALTDVYNTWRDLRILEEDSATSGVVGSTVALTATGAGNESWTSVPCWFSTPPSAEQAGIWLRASVEVVDAAQKLQVLLQQEDGSATNDRPDFGTITINGATLTLLKPIESYGSGPAIELTPGGVHYVTGPLVVYRIQDIEGLGTETDWGLIRAWYEAQIVAVPAIDSWFPISIPTASAERKIVDGNPVDEWTISLQLGQVR